MNPCGFPLLPAFLSYYVGVDEERLPPASSRVVQGLLVGVHVALGFLAVFVVVALPVSFGVGAIARAVPWAGLATGAALVAVGAITVAGMRLPLPVLARLGARRQRRLAAMLMFGVGYGAASLGCTLPLLLALIGASLGGDKITVFLAYGLGMAVVLMALAVLVAFVREGAARSVNRLLPYVSRTAGALVIAAGGYLVYYWARFRFGDSATVADDPIVSFGVRFSGHVRNFADGRGYVILAFATGVVVAAAVTAFLHRRHRSRPTSRGLARE